MAASWSVLSRVVSLMFNVFFQNVLKLEVNSASSSLEGLVVACKLSSPSLVIPEVRTRSKKSVVITSVPSSHKLIMGVQLMNFVLSANLRLLCNDISTNLGPLDTTKNLSPFDMSFSSLSEESIYGQEEDSYSSMYFDLGLGDHGSRIGHWNVNYLTSVKFDQIKLFLFGNSSSDKPQ